MSWKQGVVPRTIPLVGIVLVLGMLGYGFTIYMPEQTTSLSFLSLHLFGSTSHRQQRSDQQSGLIALIENFLKDVPRNQRQTFDRFFADDIIYTRATGQVVTKKDILADTDNPTVPRANATFAGEDFRVQEYGDMAIVNFRLVMHANENDKPVTRTFRNTGTFRKRNGVWQAIAWQATPVQEKQQ